MRKAYWFSMSFLTCLACLVFIFAPKPVVFKRSPLCSKTNMVIVYETNLTEKDLFNILNYLDEVCYNSNTGCAFAAYVHADGTLDYGCDPFAYYGVEEE